MWLTFLESFSSFETILEYQYKIDHLWSDDEKAAKNQLRRLLIPLDLAVEKKMPTRPEDMSNCPLMSKQDVENAKGC